MNRPPQIPEITELSTQARRPRAADEDLAGLIGQRLKALRIHAGLSLERLSKLAGVSRGMLSQIELGRSVPTITVLSRIAAAFELPVGGFLGQQASHAVEVLRLADSQVLESTDGAFCSRALFAFLGSRRTESYELRLRPGCTRESAAHGEGTTENLVVAEGEVEIELGQAQYRLAAGDSIYFSADVTHRSNIADIPMPYWTKPPGIHSRPGNPGNAWR